MNRSEQFVDLAAAFVKAQAAFPVVPKGGKGQIGQIKTTYATFEDVIATVRGPLADNGLSFTQMLDMDAASGAPLLTTMLIHSSGQWIAASTPIESMGAKKGTNEMQGFGSTITYLKRYALSAMLGVAIGEDDDGATSRTARKAGKKPATPAPHWIEDDSNRKAFWAWAGEQGLSRGDVHAALGVEHVKDFDGDKGVAAKAITTWMNERAF